MTSVDVSAESHNAFRQKNGLQIHTPPESFLKGGFFANEKNPAYLFGPVQEFAASLDGTTTWLIEDLELERFEAATAEGRQIEYSLYLEAASSDRSEYWIFVILPYASAQEWYDAKRAYHGRKAEKYYGKTRDEFKRALNQGNQINAELRFWILDGETSLKPLEDVIMNKYKFRPVFDLSTGRRLDPTTKAE